MNGKANYSQKHGLYANNPAYEGEPLHITIEKMLTEKTPVDGGVKPIYTDRADGVIPAYNIRTDRFDIAMEAMAKVSKSNQWSYVLMKDGNPKLDAEGNLDLTNPIAEEETPEV